MKYNFKNLKDRFPEYVFTEEDLTNEIWQPIPEWEGIYSVSNMGRVKRVNRKNGERFLASWVNVFGYFLVSLKHKEQRRHYQIHQLVGNLFIPNPENKPQINHLYGIKNDNRWHQLEWNTAQENIDHAFAIGLNKSRGETHPQAILTKQNVLDIRASSDKGVLLAKKYSVHVATISAIRHRRIWQSI